MTALDADAIGTDLRAELDHFDRQLPRIFEQIDLRLSASIHTPLTLAWQAFGHQDYATVREWLDKARAVVQELTLEIVERLPHDYQPATAAVVAPAKVIQPRPPARPDTGSTVSRDELIAMILRRQFGGYGHQVDNFLSVLTVVISMAAIALWIVMSVYMPS